MSDKNTENNGGEEPLGGEQIASTENDGFTLPESEASEAEESIGEPIVDEADTPVQPDDKTIAETEAAFAALHYSGDKGRKKYRGPKSILILILVVLGIVGLGIYAVVWSDHLRQKNEKIELRELEKRHVMSTWQLRNNEIRQKNYERAFPGEKMAPANSIYKPLSAPEKALYDARMAQYGTQFEPDPNQKALIEETKKLIEQSQPPVTKPTTAASNPAN